MGIRVLSFLVVQLEGGKVISDGSFKHKTIINSIRSLAISDEICRYGLCFQPGLLKLYVVLLSAAEIKDHLFEKLLTSLEASLSLLSLSALPVTGAESCSGTKGRQMLG